MQESPLPLDAAARELGVRPGTLRRWVAEEGCPVAQRGRRGRGCALLVDVEAVRRWRGADVADALVLELAQALPEVLANAAEQAFAQIEDDPAKRRMAGVLAAGWFMGASAVVDHLRKLCPDAAEVNSPYPEAIERLRKIANFD